MIRQNIGLVYAIFAAMIFTLMAAGAAILVRVAPFIPSYLYSLLAFPALPIAQRIMARLLPLRLPAPISRRKFWIFIATIIAVIVPLAFLLGAFAGSTEPAVQFLLGVPGAFCANLILTRWYRSKYYLIAWSPVPSE